VKKDAPVRLSSRWSGSWKYFLFALYLALIILLTFLLLDDTHHPLDYVVVVGQALANLFLFGKAWIVTLRLHQVSFDRDFAYVQMKGQELVIPLENIKYVGLASLGGTYQVTLYHPEQLGDKFYFKVSLLYPLNAKSKEVLIDRFWEAICRAKSRREKFQGNALTS
jgi:hypothetical protein